MAHIHYASLKHKYIIFCELLIDNTGFSLQEQFILLIAIYNNKCLIIYKQM